MIDILLKYLREPKFNLQDEKLLQAQIAEQLSKKGIEFSREVKLGPKDIIDFMVGDIGIEIKIQGGRRAIYRQCCSYCGYKDVQSLILLTNVSMGFPPQINGKDCYVINLGKAWL